MRKDLVAALTVTVILVPQGMAYALLAGLPPIYGLYAGLIPLFIYPLFGTSPYLSVGPVALMSIIVLSGVSQFAPPGTDRFIDLVLLSGVLAGLIQMVFSVLKLGVLANFLSRPVMTGFISAAGVIIALSQIKYFLSLDLPNTATVPDMIKQLAEQSHNYNPTSLLLGAAGIGIILLAKRIHRAIPGALIIVALGSLAAYYFHLSERGIPILGDLPSGLPKPRFDFLNWNDVVDLFPTALVIAVVCFIGSYAIANTMAPKGQEDSVLANKEFLGLGAAKVIGAFFLSFPSTGSFTRSAINKEAGAQTGFSSLFAGVFMTLVLLFAGSLFYFLPEPILAAIVITSVFSLIDVKGAKYLYSVDRSDFWIFMATFGLTLILGIVNGLLIGIGLSLLGIIIRASRPHYAITGRLPGTNAYRNISRFPEAKEEENTLIIRYDQDLFFANASHFYQTCLKEIRERPGVRHLIVNGRSFKNLDSSALFKMGQLIDELEKMKIELYFTDLQGSVRDLFSSHGFFDKVGKDHIYLSVPDAMDFINTSTDDTTKLGNEYAQQTNIDSSSSPSKRNQL
jgi:SulP family sulfate permease